MLNYLTKDDLPDGVVDIVDVIGMDAFKDLVKFAGGSNLYILMSQVLLRVLETGLLEIVLMEIIKRFLENLELVLLRLEILLIISD